LAAPPPQADITSEEMININKPIFFICILLGSCY
jgi:hypothetical protein